MRKPFKVFQLQSSLHVKESLWLLCGKGTRRKARIGTWKDDGIRKDASDIHSRVRYGMKGRWVGERKRQE